LQLKEKKQMSKWLPFCRKHLIVGVACGLASIAIMRGEARAGILQITISEGATSYTILDEGPLDTLVAPPPDNINKIQALAAALVFPDYKVIGLNASTNNPGTSDNANIVAGGEIQKITSGVSPSLIISVTDTDYSLPPSPRQMQLISSTQFTNAPVGDTKTANGWYNPSNVPYATDIPALAVPFSYSSTGLALNGVTVDTGELAVPPASLYGLTAATVITMTGAGGDLVFGGSLRVTAIPEPASVALLALGLPLVLCTLRRKRRV
jgi:hypothetical protein